MERRKTMFAVLVALIAACGGFVAGYNGSVVGSANVLLRDYFHLSDQAMGTATASAVLGCILGPFLGVWLCEALGRERTLAVAGLLVAVGAVMTAVADSILVFNVFRVVGGVGVGLCSVAAPMYIAEVSPARIRGSLGLMYQMAVVAGSTVAPLLAYVILGVFPETGPAASPAAHVLLRLFPTTVAWRWIFLSQIAVVVPFVALVFVLPHSPRWLAGRGREEEALDVLCRVDSEERAHAELEGIRASLAERAGSLRDLAGPGVRRALLVGLLLAFFNNWTGWSLMGGYIPMLLEMAGVGTGRAILGFAVTYGVMGLMTLLSVLPVERVGRRPLWMAGSAAMAVVTAATGLVFALHVRGPVVLVVLSLCAVPHGLALGGLPWLMISELFPNRVRSAAIAVTTTFLWVAIYAGAQLFPMVTGWSERVMGSGAAAFWCFTAVCVLSLLFGWKMLPETRGRTLEQIAVSWDRHLV